MTFKIEGKKTQTVNDMNIWIPQCSQMKGVEKQSKWLKVARKRLERGKGLENRIIVLVKKQQLELDMEQQMGSR